MYVNDGKIACFDCDLCVMTPSNLDILLSIRYFAIYLFVTWHQANIRHFDCLFVLTFCPSDVLALLAFMPCFYAQLSMC